MEKIKQALALAPFAALALSATYLQGYWSEFDIVPFPYLGFSELLAYAAVPLFGVVVIFVAGSSLGFLTVLEGKARGIQPRPAPKKSLVAYLNYANYVLLIVLCGLLIFRNDPLGWFVTPMVGALLISFALQRLKVVRELSTATAFVLSLGLSMLPASFGYGRMKAIRLAHNKDSRAELTLDSGTESGIILGKLGAFYFILNSADQILILPESTVKKIEVQKKYGWD